MMLRELKEGERFIASSTKGQRNPARFKVMSQPQFNLAAGTATMICYDETNKRIVSKQARLEVLKLPLL